LGAMYYNGYGVHKDYAGSRSPVTAANPDAAPRCL
jgi:hypothetical protein